MFWKKERGLNKKEADVIDVTAEVISESKNLIVANYQGVVAFSGDGFSYIKNVKRGFETINTNGDVFVPQELPEGAIVEFGQLNPNPEKEGKFRTESATVIEGEVDGLPARNVSAQALQLYQRRSIYHATAKKIDPEKIEKAAENLPFAAMMGLDGQERPEQLEIGDAAQDFLKITFANLASLGVSYSIKEETDERDEQTKIDRALETYKRNNLEGQRESLLSEYNKFKGFRKTFGLMHQKGILSLESIIPISCLPDLLMAAPVWFVHSKKELIDLTAERDPEPDHAVRFFCDLVGSKEFTWLYQIYNRRTRPFKQFKGRDIMPLPLLEIMDNVKQAFDYTIIATPYHDIASAEWTDPSWLRNIDPFLIGFVKDLPFMLLLGRWSGTGLFPLVCDMVADTIDHLEVNRKKLSNFSCNTYWLKGDNPDNPFLCLGGNENNGVLPRFAQRLIEKYEQNKLFEFLRGELSEGNNL